jgi:Flp pilus assembly CpaE family ATPase
MGARNEGKPLFQFAPKSKACQDLMELAKLLTGSTEPEPAAAESAKKRSAFSFFGSRK